MDTSYAGRGIVDIRAINKDKSVAIQKVSTEQQCVHKFAFVPEDAAVYQGNRNKNHMKTHFSIGNNEHLSDIHK